MFEMNPFHEVQGPGKSTYPFSTERLRISAFRSLPSGSTHKSTGGEQKSADVPRKTYTLIYPDPEVHKAIDFTS
jgi:hypothetical protein